jgi:hypothetical protein
MSTSKTERRDSGVTYNEVWFEAASDGFSAFKFVYKIVERNADIAVAFMVVFDFVLVKEISAEKQMKQKKETHANCSIVYLSLLLVSSKFSASSMFLFDMYFRTFTWVVNFFL